MERQSVSHPWDYASRSFFQCMKGWARLFLRSLLHVQIWLFCLLDVLPGVRAPLGARVALSLKSCYNYEPLVLLASLLGSLSFPFTLSLQQTATRMGQALCQALEITKGRDGI